MENLVAYASSSSEEETSEGRKHVVVKSTPQVEPYQMMALSSTRGESQAVNHLGLLKHNQKELHRNVTLSVLAQPMYGPNNPNYNLTNSQDMHGVGKRIITGGVVESTNVQDFNFDEQYQLLNGSKSYYGEAKKIKNKVEGIQKVREEDGIWNAMSSTTPLTDIEQGTATKEQLVNKEEVDEKKMKRARLVDDEVDFDRMIERKKSHLLPARLRAGQEAIQATSEFHDGNECDYQGRSWMEPPSHLKPTDGDHQVFVPKKCIHKWIGHSKGVQAIEFLPKYGHLILSGSMDNTVKIWDVYNERKLKRTYQGHTAAVRGINFNGDGTRFLSCSYDRYIRLWDTETGQCIQTFTNRRVPYCVKFYPKDDNLFIIGDSNNMIVQFDCKSGEIVQEYNHHLQAVNSVTFVDDDRRFVSTSDDKKILIWEWNLPVPIKYISEPSMQAMPSVTLHPSGSHFAGNSMNNQIDVYTARDKFKLCRNKIFKGHSTAGYSCQISFSPNGQYIISGDGNGRLFVWDWKSNRMYKKLMAHDKGPCIGAIWHPIEASRIATCGWDGVIKYWD